MIATCKHGHPWTVASLRVNLRNDGKPYYRCRDCHRDRDRIAKVQRYRDDPDFHAKRKALSLAYYHSRYPNDPAYREARLAYHREYTRKEKAAAQ